MLQCFMLHADVSLRLIGVDATSLFSDRTRNTCATMTAAAACDQGLSKGPAAAAAAAALRSCISGAYRAHSKVREGGNKGMSVLSCMASLHPFIAGKACATLRLDKSRYAFIHLRTFLRDMRIITNNQSIQEISIYRAPNKGMQNIAKQNPGRARQNR